MASDFINNHSVLYKLLLSWAKYNKRLMCKVKSAADSVTTTVMRKRGHISAVFLFVG